MAHLTFPVSRDGLAVPVWVGWNGTAMFALVMAGQPAPAPLGGRGLLDTGSDVTAIAPAILQRLALPVATATSTHTVSGPVNVRLFRVSTGITDPTLPPGSPWLTSPDLLVMELPAPLPNADALIGLDVLMTCKLILEGPALQFTLEF
jgi:hypothetical protein